jgi:hypothetical protein
MRHNIVIDSFEVRLPDELVREANPEEIRDLTVATMARNSVTENYFEAGFGTAQSGTTERIIAGIEMANAQRRRVTLIVNVHVGLKLRCGGVEPSAFPSPEFVAFVLATCRTRGVPLKFTAGLHHPLRHFDPGLRTHIHGFLNILVAGVLAHCRRIDEDTLREIIIDENPGDFVFDAGGLRWKKWSASVTEIQGARRMLVRSFGSCSFDEPREDLRNLGLL